jgi:hypothetical protein
MGEGVLERNDSREVQWKGTKVFCEGDVIKKCGPKIIYGMMLFSLRGGYHEVLMRVWPYNSYTRRGADDRCLEMIFLVLHWFWDYCIRSLSFLFFTFLGPEKP